MNKKIMVLGMVMLFVMVAFAAMPFNSIAQDKKDNDLLNDNGKDNKINDALFTEYTIPTASSSPLGIAINSNGTIFFTEISVNKIGKMKVVSDTLVYALITYPAIANVLITNLVYNIAYTITGTPNYKGIFNVYINYSFNNGNTYTAIIGTQPFIKNYNGSYTQSWTVPIHPSKTCLIHIDVLGYSKASTISGLFTIAYPTSVTQIYPIGNENFEINDNIIIRWNVYGNNSFKVYINYTYNGFYYPILNSPFTQPIEGNYSANWIIPNHISTTYRLNITALSLITISKNNDYSGLFNVSADSTQSLNNDFTFSFINANITSGLEEFRPYCNGTGENLDSAIIYIDFWLYYVSNHSLIHFLNDTAIINYETNEDYYYDTYLFVPDVFDSEVCRFKAKAVIVEYLILNNGNNNQINLISQIAISEPFTITNETPYLNPDAGFTNPSIYDNYTTRQFIEVMGGGTGDYLEGVNITIDMYCYFVSNSTIIHYDNYTKSNDFETGWYVDDFTTFGFNQTNVIRLIVRCIITPELICKDDNASDVVWGISVPFTITKMAVQIYSPNGNENYLVGSEQNITYNITDIQEWFTVTINISLSVNGLDGDYDYYINETEVMMGEEILYINNTINWTVPDMVSTDCYIKINVSATIPTYLTEALIDYAEDKSDDNFTIYETPVIPPIIPPTSTITITYIKIGNWEQGDITEATAYPGADIPIIIKVVSKINIYSIDIIYSIDGSTNKTVSMELDNGTVKNGYWIGYIPEQEEGTVITFHIYALNSQGDSKTTDDIEITVIAQEPVTEVLAWDTICLWTILIMAIIIVIAALFRRK